MADIENTLTKTKKDLAVFNVVVKAGLTPTEAVIEGLWHWFPNVEVALPLPVMVLKEADRVRIASGVLDEMFEVATRMESDLNNIHRDEESYSDYFKNSPDVPLIDNLWKELVGVYASLFNSYVRRLSQEEQALASEAFLEFMENNLEIDRNEAITEIQTNPSLRMQLRMIGVDPDIIK